MKRIANYGLVNLELGLVRINGDKGVID